MGAATASERPRAPRRLPPARYRSRILRIPLATAPTIAARPFHSHGHFCFRMLSRAGWRGSNGRFTSDDAS